MNTARAIASRTHFKRGISRKQGNRRLKAGQEEVSEMMTIAGADDNACWYAIRTKSQEENRAETNLKSWLVPTFAPKLKERRTLCYDIRFVSKPLFSRYIFARFDINRQLHDINYTRGVQNVVSFGGCPVSIDDEVIDLIRAQVGEDGFVRMEDEFKPGDKVRITSGPFESLGGIFMRDLNDTGRVKLLLNAMQFQGHLLIDKQLVQKANLGQSSRSN